jgi:hypothetical protein
MTTEPEDRSPPQALDPLLRERLERIHNPGPRWRRAGSALARALTDWRYIGAAGVFLLSAAVLVGMVYMAADRSNLRTQLADATLNVDLRNQVADCRSRLAASLSDAQVTADLAKYDVDLADIDLSTAIAAALEVQLPGDLEPPTLTAALAHLDDAQEELDAARQALDAARDARVAFEQRATDYAQALLAVGQDDPVPPPPDCPIRR